MKKDIYRILITGAGGFIGRNLSEYLSGRYTVFAAKRTDLDLLDAVAVEKYIKDNKINFIIHCATVGGLRSTNYDAGAADVVEKNLRMFFNLVRCMKPNMRMIHCGSGAEYDRNHWQHKMPEEYFDRHVPADSYGFSKYVISKYIEKCDNIVCLRIFGLFGKYEHYQFKFISNAILKKLLKMPININQNVVFDYLFIDDFEKIIEHLIEHNPQEKHYNITPSNSIDIKTVAKYINEVSDFKSEILVLNEGLNKEYTGDNTRLLKELNGFQFTKYKTAIAILYRYYASIIHELDIETIVQDPHLRACKVNKS